MKRILFGGLLAVAALGLVQSRASAICFDCYRPCVRVPLPRLPIFLPKICLRCDTEGAMGCCGQKSGLLFNHSAALAGGGYGHGGHGCSSCGGHPLMNHALFGKFHGGFHHCAPLCGYPDCNRPMYPNPGYGYHCWYGNVGPWYGYWPPSAPTGYQVGAYGAFRSPVAAAASYYSQPAAPYYSQPAPTYIPASYNVPSYWYGR
jgi:hypothetical protein